MTIKTKDWNAQIAAAAANNYLRVNGTVTVSNHGITARLVRSPIQVKPYELRLDLELKPDNRTTLQIENDKPVEYKAMGNHSITGVNIHFEGELIHHIDKILITY